MTADRQRQFITEREVDAFVRERGPKWYQRDISRGVTSAVALAVLALTAMFVYFDGWTGIVDSLIFCGGILALVAIYLTCAWEWPRLFRYFRTLWREYRGH